MAYLIDTNIIIFALKAPGRSVAQKFASLQAGDILVSTVVEAELYHGAEKYGQPERRKEVVREFLALFLRVPFDSLCVPHYAAIRHHLETQGHVIGGNDLMIAATALAHDLTLVTHNSAEFARVPGLKLEDWA